MSWLNKLMRFWEKILSIYVRISALVLMPIISGRNDLKCGKFEI